MSFGDEYESIFGPILPVPMSRIQVARDGDRLAIGARPGRELLVFETPGHAPHHVSLLDTSTGGLFCGEALGLVYRRGGPPLPAVTLPNFDPEIYLNDMRRLRALKPAVLFYSHLGISLDPDKAIQATIENTIAFGSIVREAVAGETVANEAVANEATEEGVLRYVAKEVLERFGVRLSDYELASNTRAFVDYYRRRAVGGGGN
ncbi:MAG: hypothetical protein A2147_02405 [Chloroflexi bacterium RBG_16_57_8]|nr:MAG: hypothetical protein A2147_02405 [Chloroflexi bacterium RBG_16_57_8]